jgi:hypothetical protein
MIAPNCDHNARPPEGSPSMPDFGANNLDAFWMPFTPNRRFKAHPRMLSSAKDMHYRTPEGREILDATSGLWCVNAGHDRPASARRSRSRPPRWTTRRASTWATRWPSPSPASWPRSRPRPGPDLLHQQRLGVGRHRPEDRAGLPPRPGQGDQDPADRPRARLSRRRLRRHLGGRHPQEPDVFRLPADRRRPPAPHPRRGRKPVRQGEPEHGATSPTTWSGSSPCTTPPTSPP